jgi:hypothetical protein
MINISGTGTGIVIVALQSFPMGFNLTQFADDIDPLAAEEVEATGFEMLYDGSLFAFDKAAPIMLTVGVIAGSSDDINLKIMLQTRKSNVSILPFQDVVSAVISYPDGGRIILSNGALIKGPLIDGVQNTGRKKGNAYAFAFGSFAGAQSAKQLVASVAQAALGLL